MENVLHEVMIISAYKISCSVEKSRKSHVGFVLQKITLFPGSQAMCIQVMAPLSVCFAAPVAPSFPFPFLPMGFPIAKGSRAPKGAGDLAQSPTGVKCYALKDA